MIARSWSWPSRPALAAFTYLWLERAGPRGWCRMLCRAVAWAALGLLLLNVSCPVRGAPLRPLVLLDASLSMSAGGRWAEARDSAARWGEVRTFGDERTGRHAARRAGDRCSLRLWSRPSASDRPVIVVTDGEIEDAADIAAELLTRRACVSSPGSRCPISP